MANYLTKNQLEEINFQPQKYKNYEITLMRDHITEKAARFRLFGTKQNIWIPRRHLDETMTLKPSEKIDYIFCSQDVVNKLALIIRELQSKELKQLKRRLGMV